MSVYTVSLQHLTEEFKLEMLFQASDFEKIQIIVEDVNRPALQLAGFFEHFEPARLQVIGLVEGHLPCRTDAGTAGGDL